MSCLTSYIKKKTELSLNNKKDIVNDAVLKNSIIQVNTKLSNTIIANSMIGEGAEVKGKALDISMSDYTTLSL